MAAKELRDLPKVCGRVTQRSFDSAVQVIEIVVGLPPDLPIARTVPVSTRLSLCEGVLQRPGDRIPEVPNLLSFRLQVAIENMTCESFSPVVCDYGCFNPLFEGIRKVGIELHIDHSPQ